MDILLIVRIISMILATTFLLPLIVVRNKLNQYRRESLLLIILISSAIATVTGIINILRYVFMLLRCKS